MQAFNKIGWLSFCTGGRRSMKTVLTQWSFLMTMLLMILSESSAIAFTQNDFACANQGDFGGTCFYQPCSSDGSGTATTTGPTTSSGGVSFDDSQSSDTGNQTTIDEDGFDAPPGGSNSSGTSYASGKLSAFHTNYMVLNPGWASANGLVLGDVAALTYKGKTVYAVYGDNYIGNTVHSEISVAAAKALGTSGTDSLTGVHTNVYPGTSAQLAGSVDQSKIDQIGAQASGGGSPSSSSSSSSTGSCCPSGSGSSGATTLTGSGNAQQAFNYFVNTDGLPPAAAAGLVGNFQQESGDGLDTHSNNGSHVGIAQWDTGGRWAGLLSHESGKDPYALSTQLDYVTYELNGSYKSSVLDPLKKSTDPSEAAAIVFNFYEKPGDSTLPKRQANAVKLLQDNGGSASGSAPGGSATTSCPAAPTTTASKPNFIDLSSGTHFGNGHLSNINVLLIHYTEGNSEGAALQSYFNGNGLGVQFNIGLTGKVYQYFPLNDMQLAWQAYQISTHAIGIEITGMDGEALLNNQAQFDSVVNTVKYLCDYYNIPCSSPKGDITNTSEPDAQGLLGHSEAPGNDHSDPDTKIVNGVDYNIVTGKVWTSADRHNSSTHAYMIKLRKALGYNSTP